MTAKSKDCCLILHSSFHFIAAARVSACSKVKTLFAKLVFVDFMQKNFVVGKEVKYSVARGNNLH